MRTLSRYERTNFDRDAAMMSEAPVVNVSPYVARFEIATTPGAQPRRYKLEPGQSVHIQVGYTKSFTGAGRQPVRATIESLTEREVWPKGPTLPMVVHKDRASDIGSQWIELIERGAAPPEPIDIELPRADGGEPIKMTVRQAEAPRSRAAPIIEDEDQADGPLDEPPPDHNEPLEPVTLPTAAIEGKGKRR